MTDERRYIDSTGRTWSLWDAAHNATAQVRDEFDGWATRVFGAGWCEKLFGADQHGDRFDHELRRWVVPA